MQSLAEGHLRNCHEKVTTLLAEDAANETLLLDRNAVIKRQQMFYIDRVQTVMVQFLCIAA